jgi:GMP synthase (glutamine-hydrolysing)
MSKPILILRHVPHESAGTVENALNNARLDFQYLDLFDKYPTTIDHQKFSGIIVLGGPMNVDEVKKHPFLEHEPQWIRQTVDAGTPLLGICLGSQLLAKAMGAKVYANGIKEIGWYPLELTPAALEDPLFAACNLHQTVFQWHGDTFDLPLGAVHMAQSPLCRNQAFRIGSKAYGLQFHIEMTAEMIEDWLTESVNCGELALLDYIDPNIIRQKTLHELPGLQALSKNVVGRFAALCMSEI